MRRRWQVQVVVTAAAIAGMTGAGLTGGVQPVAAAEKSHLTIDVAGDDTPKMDSYPEQEFYSAAGAVPADLAGAISRDLDQSPATYLAEAAAAIDAVTVVDALVASGVDVLDSRLDGTTLIVNVASSGDAAAVTAAGALPELGDPAPPEISLEDFKPASEVLGGQGYIWTLSDTTSYQCSVGFAGVDGATGAARIVTAGHCVQGMSTIMGTVDSLIQSAPASSGGSRGDPIGSPVSGTGLFGDGYDSGLVSVSGAGAVARAAVVTWGGSSGAPMATAPVAVTGQSAAIVGASLCKSGSRTGWSCGTIRAVDVAVSVGGVMVNSIVATTCVQPGDSGGSALIGHVAVGVTSSTSSYGCTDPRYLAGFFPMVSSAGGRSVSSAYGAGWEPSVSVAVPTVNSPDSTGASGTVNFGGSLASASARSRVAIYVDGATTPSGSSSAATGSWAITVSGLASGQHTFAVVGLWGLWSASNPVNGTVTVPQSCPSGDLRNAADSAPRPGVVVASAGTYSPFTVDNAGTLASIAVAGATPQTSIVAIWQNGTNCAAVESSRNSWAVAPNGRVFATNASTGAQATFFGDASMLPLNRPIVGMSPTPTGLGYWLVASDGGIFSYGDASFYGSTGAIRLNQPIVGMSGTATGRGYWLVASDGGIFAFGDAAFHGSAGALPLNKPISGMTVTPTGEGYWMVASDGGIFSYGDAAFHGSTGDRQLPSPISGMITTAGGYTLIGHEGELYRFV
jgi:hypothetical protein